jgi:hypothetical protein
MTVVRRETKWCGRMSRAARTRASGTLTEAAYWGKVRSALRRGFRYWKPATDTKLAARRKYKGSNKLQKWEFLCASCNVWHKDKNVEIDHIIEAGSLKCSEDLAGFLERLTPEEGYQILCKPCHNTKGMTEEDIKELAFRKLNAAGQRNVLGKKAASNAEKRIEQYRKLL